MGKYIVKAVTGVGLIALAMYGLWHKIEYSGWVLFFGFLALCD